MCREVEYSRIWSGGLTTNPGQKPLSNQGTSLGLSKYNGNGSNDENMLDSFRSWKFQSLIRTRVLPEFFSDVSGYNIYSLIVQEAK